MKFLFSWLKEYIDIKLPAAEVAKTLTSLGIEVDAVHRENKELTGDDDCIFEVSLTPNLGHCASILGIARELVAARAGTLKLPEITVKESDKAISGLAEVKVLNSTLCPRYTCRVVTGVVIAPSPEWMQKRLLAAGIRPINNVVDVTNYVALEIGQPTHAFDYDLLQEHSIIVRNAKEGEEFTTLDDVKRTLTEQDLLICDGHESSSRPIAIAGVMGGQNTEVSDITQNVLIEAANFSPTGIRRTSRQLNLQTDASKRFERSVDPNGPLWGVHRAAQLMQELSGGTVVKGVIDSKPEGFERRHISCRLSRINGLLGTQLGVGEVEEIFDRLDFCHAWDGKDSFALQIPTYRADVTAEIDVVEEVARIYGYDNLPKRIPYYHGSNLPHAPMFLFEREVRSHLLAAGLQELLTCDLIGPQLLGVVGKLSMPSESNVKVLNPTSQDQSILRTSLLPGLLQVVKYNHDHQQPHLAGFEIGRIHFKDGEQFKEQTMAGIVLSGLQRQPHWERKPVVVDFFDLKGLIEGFLNGIEVDHHFVNSDLESLHPGRQLAIYSGSLKIGSLGEVHPEIVTRLDVPGRIYFAEISLHDLFKLKPPPRQASALPQFPASERDWTVTLPLSKPIQEIFDHFNGLESKLLENVSLIDLYCSDKLGIDMRNATFRFVYRDKQKTLAQPAVDAEHLRIIDSVKQRFAL